MANVYLNFVNELARLVNSGKSLPLGGFPPAPRPTLPADAPKVLFFAPHPDDETIIGGLALRLLREANWRVVDIAVTQGSNKERQAARFQELTAACQHLGFEVVQTAPNGLEKVSPKTREADPAYWNSMVKAVASLLSQHQPKVVFCPHDKDWNSTHIGVHYLVMDALKTLPASFQCFVVETEFWAPMESPNLMVEYTPDLVAAVVTATSFHVGEVKRNPYHLSIPAWMMDNVRRGAEVVGGQGGAAPDYTYAQLFRLRKWTGTGLENCYTGGKNLSAHDNAASLFV